MRASLTLLRSKKSTALERSRLFLSSSEQDLAKCLSGPPSKHSEPDPSWPVWMKEHWIRQQIRAHKQDNEYVYDPWAVVEALTARQEKQVK